MDQKTQYPTIQAWYFLPEIRFFSNPIMGYVFRQLRRRFGIARFLALVQPIAKNVLSFSKRLGPFGTNKGLVVEKEALPYSNTLTDAEELLSRGNFFHLLDLANQI